MQAATVLMQLSNQCDKKNESKQPITDGEVDAIEHSLKKVLDGFMSLADFKAKHAHQVSSLDGMPIDEKMVATMQDKLPWIDFLLIMLSHQELIRNWIMICNVHNFC